MQTANKKLKEMSTGLWVHSYPIMAWCKQQQRICMIR